MTGSRKPHQRPLRVGEEIRHILSEILSYRHSGDDLLDRSSITVTEVRVSPDLHNATVFVMPLGGEQCSEILQALRARAWFFRKEVARRLKARITPHLLFQPDLSFDEVQNISTLLKSPRVTRDLKERSKE